MCLGVPPVPLDWLLKTLTATLTFGWWWSSLTIALLGTLIAAERQHIKEAQKERRQENGFQGKRLQAPLLGFGQQPYHEVKASIVIPSCQEREK